MERENLSPHDLPNALSVGDSFRIHADEISVDELNEYFEALENPNVLMPYTLIYNSEDKTYTFRNPEGTESEFENITNNNITRDVDTAFIELQQTRKVLTDFTTAQVLGEMLYVRGKDYRCVFKFIPGQGSLYRFYL